MNDSPKFSPTGESKYAWYAELLRRQIVEGTLKPGDRLPSRTAVRALHQITQPTIEKAQAILEREGLIVRRERLGVFVADGLTAPNVSDGTRRSPVVSAGTIGILAPGDGMVRPGHRQPGWSDYIAQGTLAACRDLGHHALFLNPSRLQGEELRQLLDHPPMGFVFPSLATSTDFQSIETLLRQLKQHEMPVVVFGGEAELEDFDRVACDHETGCYELTLWLIERGCRKILPFWPPVNSGDHWLVERLAGYRRAMKEGGLEPLAVREVPQRHQPMDPDDTREKFDATVRHKAGYLADMLRRDTGCDAILEVSDGEVPSTAGACRLLGYEPNRDVLIAGYDNYWRDAMELAFEPCIPIATVDKHNWEAGRELVKVLMARVSGDLPAGPHLSLIQPELLPLNVALPFFGRATATGRAAAGEAQRVAA